jgi:small conductance mechanosensitive channel
MEWLKNFLNTLVSWATTTGIKIIIALVVLFISFKLVKWIGKKIVKGSEGKKLDKTIVKTLVHTGTIFAKCIIVVCLIGYLGIDTSAITALIASFGVCIGLAVNGAVSNFAGGVLILVTRPFKVDDFIEAQGVSGVVADINITNTKIITGDQKVVYVPNGALSNGTIINYSEKENRRVDIDFTIGYAADSEKAKAIVMDLMKEHALVLKDPAPFVHMSEHGSSAIVLKTRAWVKNADYWTVYFDLMEAVKKEFDANGIEIPFDQLDVHIKKD